MEEQVHDPYDYMKGDPRGWYEQDHSLWVDLLKEAREINNSLCSYLYSFRMAGTAIQKNSKGQYVLRPYIDRKKEVSIWGSVEQYRYYSEKYLKPYTKELVFLLKKLTNKKMKEEKSVC